MLTEVEFTQTYFGGNPDKYKITMRDSKHITVLENDKPPFSSHSSTKICVKFIRNMIDCGTWKFGQHHDFSKIPYDIKLKRHAKNIIDNHIEATKNQLEKLKFARKLLNNINKIE